MHLSHATISLPIIAVGIALVVTGNALEATAGARDVGTDNASLNMRLEASNALLTAAFNDLKNGIKACSAKQAFYNPDGAGADADGCVPLQISGTTTEEVHKRIWSGSVKSGTGLSLSTGSFADCSSITLVGGNATRADTTTVPAAVFKARSTAGGYVGMESFSGDDSGFFGARYVDDTHFSTISYRNGALYEIWCNG